ncbi:hypothetical protein LTR04_004518 [Oleoguttula sp. CCFEE 6159]|nr:hypothetical protein LTR04_004518 [Oleoguttula sp. CCFEE 6159]
MAPRKPKTRNPLAFTPLPVTIISSIVYAGLIAALLVVHLVVPSAPSNSTPVKGVNTTEAWADLKELSNGFHPYNSRRNDQVRDWLLRRIETILARNEVKHSTESLESVNDGLRPWNATAPAPVVVFNDMTSNITFSSAATHTSVYFEGTNIIVYIRGSEDEGGDWWKQNSSLMASKAYSGKGGVLVNAHYDSVSTGFGATDDGVGVVTVLQLISYFTSPGKKPRKGIVALLNNGEEDYLNGARAFVRHPIAQFPHAFLNLEGAAAGGRATLFRSTDTEVTRFYKKSRHPFGTVISGDGFNRGLIRSQTDYVVFNGELGLRGLDLAFMEPRARYHTTEDDARDTSIDSLWHMLSAALATVEGLSSDRSPTFEGKTSRDGKAGANAGSDGVWFDIFGRAFAVFQLHTLFALSVTLLVVTPLVLIALNVVLSKTDKWYLLSRRRYLHSVDDDDPIPLNGWRGFFRYPIVFIAATAAVVGLAFLLTKINPYIIYSSEYAVWSMMLSAWLAVAWFLLRIADFARPTALNRIYSLIWLYIGSFVIVVAVTVAEQRLQIAGGYFMVIYFAAIFAALLVSYLELFALPKKSVYVRHMAEASRQGSLMPVTRRSSIVSARPVAAPTTDDRPRGRDGPQGDEGEDATETTSLLRGDRGTSFARYRGRRSNGATDGATEEHEQEHRDALLDEAFGDEQPWSGSLPRWLWVIQFLLLAPIVIVLVGQVGLLLTSALSQTAADGSAVFTVYIAIAILSVLILAPLVPFLHRFTFHIPTFLFLVFVGTLVYNLFAFPFSPNNRLKVYFVQQVDLDSGLNRVSLTGLADYVEQIIAEIPSAHGSSVCGDPEWSNRAGLTTCSWDGLPPRVVSSLPEGVPPEKGYAEWVDYNNEATFTLFGKNTRACRLLFNSPISDFHVEGAASDSRFEPVAEAGSTEIRLWSREWEKPWTVHVSWKGEGELGLDGKAVCLWSDANESGTVPALDEIRRFMPVWSAVSKGSDGLVEGYKHFSV